MSVKAVDMKGKQQGSLLRVVIGGKLQAEF